MPRELSRLPQIWRSIFRNLEGDEKKIRGLQVGVENRTIRSWRSREGERQLPLFELHHPPFSQTPNNLVSQSGSTIPLPFHKFSKFNAHSAAGKTPCNPIWSPSARVKSHPDSPPIHPHRRTIWRSIIPQSTSNNKAWWQSGLMR